MRLLQLRLLPLRLETSRPAARARRRLVVVVMMVVVVVVGNAAHVLGTLTLRLPAA